MKICQVLCSRGRGGLERHFVDLCNALSERHEVIAVAHPEFGERLNERVRFEAVDLSGWRFHPLSLVRLYGILRKHAPDVIHAQANKAAAMAGVLRPVITARWVATVHNLKRDTTMFGVYDRVIAVSQPAAAQLKHPHATVIYNGIAPPAPPADGGRHPLYAGLEAPLALAVGRLVPAKGFDQLLRAWTEVPASLVIVGDGPERERLAQQLRALHLDHRVRLAGFRRDATALMAGADLMVMASRNEGFPYVLAEGLHLRKVIVATRVPGALDVLPAAFLADYGEPRQMADILRRVLQDLPAAQRAFAPVWEFAARELTLARMTEHTEQVYREALSA
jgi:glycosyltransferase involved in cell wall biosynthesis